MSEQPKSNAVVKTLVVRAQAYLCALPLELVIEAMRPLPIEPIAGVPAFVRGMSIIRGEPTPVIDLALLLGAPREMPWRFVTIRVAGKQVALSVGAVAGIFELDPRDMDPLPPMLRGADTPSQFHTGERLYSLVSAPDDETGTITVKLTRSQRLIVDCMAEGFKTRLD